MKSLLLWIKFLLKRSRRSTSPNEIWIFFRFLFLIESYWNTSYNFIYFNDFDVISYFIIMHCLMLLFFLHIIYFLNILTKRKLNCRMSKSCYDMAFIMIYIVQQIKNEFPIRYKAIFLLNYYWYTYWYIFLVYFIIISILF